MKTRTVNLYIYEELDDGAKAKARDWCRDALQGDTYWSESVIDDFVHMMGLIGFTFDTRSVPLMNGTIRNDPKVYWSGFCSQGDGASFEGLYEFKPHFVATIKKEYPTDTTLHGICDRLQALQVECRRKLGARVTRSGRYCHECSMRCQTVLRIDTDKVPTDEQDEELMDIMRDLAHWLYRYLEAEYEYQNSDEQIAETLIINEYFFTEDGSIH